MLCPRCQAPARPINVPGGGGAYREALRAAFMCSPCGVTMLDRTTSGDVTKTLGRSMLVRARKPSVLCPSCPEKLERLTLSWDTEWVDIEECVGCRTVVFDRGELERLQRMVAASTHHSATVEAALAIAAWEEEEPSMFEQIGGWISGLLEL